MLYVLIVQIIDLDGEINECLVTFYRRGGVLGSAA